MAKEYFKKNFIPVTIEILFVSSCVIVPKGYFIYTNCLFYLLLFFYFVWTKDFVLKDWFASFQSGKIYWKQVLLTLLAFIAAFGITLLLESVFTDLETGMIGLRRDSMFLYALEHSLSWWGILLTMIWALPLTAAYIKTRNVSVVMTAHFIGNLLGNGVDVVLTVLQWLKR